MWSNPLRNPRPRSARSNLLEIHVDGLRLAKERQFSRHDPLVLPIRCASDALEGHVREFRFIEEVGISKMLVEIAVARVDAADGDLDIELGTGLTGVVPLDLSSWFVERPQKAPAPICVTRKSARAVNRIDLPCRWAIGGRRSGGFILSGQTTGNDGRSR